MFTIYVPSEQHDMPSLGAHQVAGYLRKRGVNCIVNYVSSNDDMVIKGKYVGVSISFASQINEVSKIIRKIREKSSDTIVLLGGSYFSFCNNPVELDFDILVRGYGEIVLDYVLNEDLSGLLDKGVKIVRIGQKCIIDSCGIKEKVKMDPNYNDIDLDGFVLRRTVPYLVRDGCYYRKCRFCSDTSVSIYYSDSMRNAVSRMNHFPDNVETMYLMDAALHPRSLKYLAKNCSKIKFNWIANARFDNALLENELFPSLVSSGCTMLRFGLESGSQRILELMRKGTNLETVREILRRSSTAGIKNHLYVMFGFPDEIDTDREATIEFLYDMRDYFSTYQISIFQPFENTPIYNDLKCTSEKIGTSVIDIVYSEARYAKVIQDIERCHLMLSKDYVHVH